LNWYDVKIDGPRKMIALGWKPGLRTGWEVVGFNIALQLCRTPTRGALALQAPDLNDIAHPLYRMLLKPVADWHAEFMRALSNQPGQGYALDIPFLHALANDFGAGISNFRGKPNVGLIVSESTVLSPEGLARSRNYDLILAGSTWNAEVLQSNGLSQARPLLQGIDPTLFHPAPKAGLFPGRFVIFSGGKLEYRKGQDIVVAAFKKFKTRHPEAFLLTQWQNMWPQFMLGMDQVGHVQGIPQIDAQRQLLLQPWLAHNGINPLDWYDAGMVPNYLVPQVIREADVTLFPNRGEGGTNLVAMECLASGLPTILSANTGHLDLIGDDRCYPLRTQRPAMPTAQFPGTEGWGESDVDECVEQLEAVYQDREEARRRGSAATKFMEDWSWEKQVDRLVAACQ
jgi:glycosyltransferase involved in cell wall biosynthesis